MLLHRDGSAFKVFFSKEIVDGFDRVEGGERHLDENGGPVCHGSVPETGQLLRLEDGGTLAVLANESCSRVNILSQVEVAATVVLGGADEVDGVEVGGSCKDGFLGGVFGVDLGSFDNLEALDTLGVEGEEGTAAGFALVLDHAADTHRAVEEGAKELGLFFEVALAVVLVQVDVELFLGKAFDFGEVFLADFFVEIWSFTWKASS